MGQRALGADDDVTKATTVRLTPEEHGVLSREASRLGLGIGRYLALAGKHVQHHGLSVEVEVPDRREHSGAGPSSPATALIVFASDGSTSTDVPLLPVKLWLPLGVQVALKRLNASGDASLLLGRVEASRIRWRKHWIRAQRLQAEIGDP